MLPVQGSLHQKDQELYVLRESRADEAGPAATAMREVGHHDGRLVKASCTLSMREILKHLVLYSYSCRHRATCSEALMSSCCYTQAEARATAAEKAAASALEKAEAAQAALEESQKQASSTAQGANEMCVASTSVLQPVSYQAGP